jgi:hypothetical protein
MSNAKFTAPYSPTEIYFEGVHIITIQRKDAFAPSRTGDLSKVIMKALNKSRTAKSIAKDGVKP